LGCTEVGLFVVVWVEFAFVNAVLTESSSLKTVRLPMDTAELNDRIGHT